MTVKLWTVHSSAHMSHPMLYPSTVNEVSGRGQVHRQELSSTVEVVTSPAWQVTPSARSGFCNLSLVWRPPCKKQLPLACLLHASVLSVHAGTKRTPPHLELISFVPMTSSPLDVQDAQVSMHVSKSWVSMPNMGKSIGSELQYRTN